MIAICFTSSFATLSAPAIAANDRSKYAKRDKVKNCMMANLQIYMVGIFTMMNKTEADDDDVIVDVTEMRLRG